MTDQPTKSILIVIKFTIPNLLRIYLGVPVELHGPDHPVLLGTDADQEQPVGGCVAPVVDNLKIRII